MAITFALLSSQAYASPTDFIKELKNSGFALNDETVKALEESKCNVTKEQIENDEIPAGCGGFFNTLVDLTAASLGDETAEKQLTEALNKAFPNTFDTKIAENGGLLTLDLASSFAPTAAGTPDAGGVVVNRSLASGSGGFTPSFGGGTASSSPN